MNEKDFDERRNASLDAKKAMVEKFRSAANRNALLPSCGRPKADEAVRKAERDAKYAARKARKIKI